LVEGAFKRLRGEGIHGETDFAVGAQLPDIGLVDIGEHLHFGQILCIAGHEAGQPRAGFSRATDAVNRKTKGAGSLP
jgi:hypothetical protein